MALTSKVLTIVPESIFTSQGNNAITTMYVCNTSNAAAQFSMYAVPSGQTATNDKLMYYQVPLAAGDTYVIDSEKLVLGPGDALYASVIDPVLVATQGLADTGWGANAEVYTAYWSSDRSEYIVGGAGGKVAVSQTGEDWEYISELSTLGWTGNVNVNSITRAPYQKYLVVGDSGWMATSSDGVNWENAAVLRSSAWGVTDVYAAANNGSVYIIVGASGKIATSTNAVDWTLRTQLQTTGWSTSDIWSVIWDGDRFVIGGEGGKIAYSADGETWTYVNSLATNLAWGAATRVNALVYSGSPAAGYLAVTRDSNRAATSVDGNTWVYSNGLATIGTSGTPGSASAVYRPGYGFYVLGLTPKVYKLSSLGTWTVQNSDLLNLPWNSQTGYDLVWNPDRAEFLAVGADASVATSQEAVLWTYRTTSDTANVSLPNVVVTVSSIGI
jgi:hypothetical protein